MVVPIDQMLLHTNQIGLLRCAPAYLFSNHRRHSGSARSRSALLAIASMSHPPSTPPPSGDAAPSAAATLQLRAFRQQAKAELRAALTQMQQRGISYAAKWSDATTAHAIGCCVACVLSLTLLSAVLCSGPRSCCPRST